MNSISTIEGYIQSTFPNKTILLNDDLMTGVGADAVWGTYFPTQQLSFSSANIDPSNTNDTQVTYVGSVKLFNITVSNARLIFLAVNNSNQVVLLVPLPDSWQFPQSFSNLPQCLDFSTGMPTPQNNYLTYLTLSDPYFVFCSAGYSDTSLNINVDTGLNFTALLSLSGPLAQLAPFAGQQYVPLSGPIALGTIQSLSLKADIPFNVSFLDNKVALNNVQVSLYSTFGTTATPATESYLTGQLKVSSYLLDIACPLLLGGGDFFVVEGVFESDAQPQLPSLDEIADLVGGCELEKLLPSQLQGDSDVYITRVECGIGVSAKSLLFTGFTIACNKTWEIIPNKVTVTAINLSFLVPAPFDGKNISMALSGTFQFGTDAGTALTIGASYPDWLMFCGLAPGSVINLSNVFSHFGWDISKIGVDDFTCKDFDLTVATTTGYFTVFADLQGSWNIPIGPDTLDITGLTIQCENAGGLSLSATGSFMVNQNQFVISGAENAGGQGWDFSGAMVNDKPINLVSLLNDLVSVFGGSLPDASTSINVGELSVSLNTGTGAFQFIGTTDMTSTLTLCSNTFTLDAAAKVNILTYTDSSGKRQFTGTLAGDVTVGNSTITLEYDMGEQASTIKANWNGADGTTLGADDILKLLGISVTLDIPSGLDLSMTQLGFEYDVTKEMFTLSGTSKNYGSAFITVAKDVGGNWAVVFGVDFPAGALSPNNKLSSLPVIGGDLKAADAFPVFFQQAGVMISSGTFNNYSIPILPPMYVSIDLSSVNIYSGLKTVQPIATGSTLNLSPGLSLAAILDFGTAGKDASMSNLQGVVNKETLVVQVSFSTTNFTVFIGLDNIQVPSASNPTFTLAQAAMKIDIGTLMSIQAFGSMDFTINGKEIQAKAILTISDTEAQVAVDIQSDNSSLPAPSGVTGFELQEFGIEMGVIFEPPSFDLGIEGQFSIGGQAQPSTNQFALVLAVVGGEVPDPMLLWLYVSSVDLGEASSWFVPNVPAEVMSALNGITVSDISFYWCESLVVLPDGTVAKPGFGFSGAIQIFSFSAYVYLQVSLTGIEGDAQMSPIQWTGLSITGDGPGLPQTPPSGTVDCSSQSLICQNASFNSVQKPTIAAGGPMIHISTHASPYLSVTIAVTLLDIASDSVSATIDSSGIAFALTEDIASIDSFTLSCTLEGLSSFNASAGFSVDLNQPIGPVMIDGVNCGSINLGISMSATIAVSITDSDFGVSLITSDTDFMGATIPAFTLSFGAEFSSFTNIPSEIIHQLVSDAQHLLGNVFGDAESWANSVKNDMVTGADDACKVLHDVYHVAPSDITSMLKDLGESADDIAKGLQSIYGFDSKDVAKALKEAGFSLGDIIKALKSVFSLGVKDLIHILEKVGFGFKEIWHWIKKL